MALMGLEGKMVANLRTSGTVSSSTASWSGSNGPDDTAEQQLVSVAALLPGCSAVVARLVWDQKVAGSIPVTPIMSDRSEKWEEYVASLKALPDDECRDKVYGLSVVWEDDYYIFQCLLSTKGEEMKQTQQEYNTERRRTLMESFGYAGVL